jgi:hypothetical protein
MKNKQANLLSNPLQWTSNISFRVKNYVQTSKVGVYAQQFQLQFAYHFVVWLMARNGIQSAPGEDPMWSFLMGELSDEALEKGVAKVDLYLINTQFNLFGWQIPLKIRGFTLMSVAGDGDEKNMKNFSNVPARALFNTPRLLAEIPAFPARPWDDVTRAEKGKVKKTMMDNQERLWAVTELYCQTLQDRWNTERSAPYNIASLTFNIMTRTFYGVEALHPAFVDYLSEFEDIWLHPDQLTAAKLSQAQANFKLVTQKLYSDDVLVDELPPKKGELIDSLYQHHAENTTFINKKEDFNAVALLSIVGNLPRTMIRLMYHVFADPALMARLKEEKVRLADELEYCGLDINSKKGFDFILAHSELFQRLYFEVLRVAYVVPAMVRLNTNIFFNTGKDWNINQDVSVLPRTLAILPQRRIAMNQNKYGDPKQFNPDRSEYHFDIDDNGRVTSKSEPLVFGPLDSARACPGRDFTRKLFYSMLWWMSEYQQFEFSADEAHKIDLPNERIFHHAPLDERKAFGDSIKGHLTPLYDSANTVLQVDAGDLGIDHVARLSPKKEGGKKLLI